ncbi:hypothetical protein FHL15_006940 [Xylaria flabelliformis]|uniref:DUF7143 domain-containing protein n=1 Tax=Xylaria flabelliformis TaxID=2512241 RepID=A0A553HVV7_9PEZI|nr:hypothetical protein FHL15_006940 [Xylaria flabelliformis]
MRSQISSILVLASAATALPKIPFVTTYDKIPSVLPRQQQACFVIGSETLPAETQDVASTLASSITCDTSKTTLSGVPDVSSSGLTFSSVDFSTSGQSPLEFALNTFFTADTLADSNLAAFEAARDVYLATEAGIRSVGGNLAIKVPKFFLEFQGSRIQTAQGNPPTDAGLQVDHLLDKVLTNGAGEDQDLLDQVKTLATQLQ